MQQILALVFLSVVSTALAEPPPSEVYVHHYPDPVNIRNGNLYLMYDEVYLAHPSLPIRIVRSFSSYNKSEGFFGIGWSFNYQLKLTELTSGQIMLVEGDNYTTLFFQEKQNNQKQDKKSIIETILQRRIDEDKKNGDYKGATQYETMREKLSSDDHYFQDMSGRFNFQSLPLPNGTYISVNRGLQRIVKSSRGYRLTTKTGELYVFTPQGQLERIENAGGQAITFNYFQDKLNVIKDRAGRAITITYESSGHIGKIIDPAGNKINYTYDQRGRLTEVAYSKDKILRYKYNEPGHLIEMVYPDGQSTKITYDFTGQAVTELTGPGNRKTKIEYLITNFDNNHFKRTITDSLGNKTSYLFEGEKVTTYAADGGRRISMLNKCCYSPLQVTNEAGATETYTYNEDGKLTSYVDGAGTKIAYSYDKDGNAAAIASIYGSSFYKHDKAGHLTAVANPDGSTYRYLYYDNGDFRGILYPNDFKEALYYDKAGNLSSLVGSSKHRLDMSYDELGNLLDIKESGGKGSKGSLSLARDPEGRITLMGKGKKKQAEISYDVLGNITAFRNESANTIGYAYDKEGNLASIKAKDTEISLNYDNEGRLASYANAVGQKTEFSYDQRGRIAKINDPIGSTYHYYYDPAGNLTEFRDSMGNREEYWYDNSGRLAKILKNKKPLLSLSYGKDKPTITLQDAFSNKVSTLFDVHNKPLEARDGVGGVVSFRYDKMGNLTERIANEQPESSYAYDTEGRLTKFQHLQSGYKASYAYDERGNMTSLSSGATGTTTYEYDSSDALKEISYANGLQAKLSYDSTGNISKVEMPDGGKVSYRYDHLNRIKSYQYKNDEPYLYVWDRSGSLTSQSNSNNKVSYVYDDIGQLLQVLHGETIAAVFQYDDSGRIIRAENDVTTQTFRYDLQGRVLEFQDKGTGTIIIYDYEPNGIRRGFRINDKQREWKYDSLQRIKSISLDGASVVEYKYGGSGSIDREVYPSLGWEKLYSYDPKQRIAAISYRSKAGSDIKIAYAYDNKGNVTAKTDGLVAWKYAYDKANNLVETALNGKKYLAYSYDAVGNRLTEEENGKVSRYTYDGDQLISAGGANFSYDPRGNVSSIASKGELWEFRYRDDGKLKEVLSNKKPAVSYAFDPFGRRYKRTAGGKSEFYLYDGMNIVGILRGKTLEQIVYGYGEMQPLLFAGTEGQQLPIKDALGSVMRLVDRSGKELETRLFQPFGKLASKTPRHPFGFNGKRFDPETGLIDYIGRFYAPQYGRFISRDPLGPNGELNAYAYVLNNPQTFADPLGLKGFNYFYPAHSPLQQQNGYLVRSPLPRAFLPHEPFFPSYFNNGSLDALSFVGNPTYFNPSATRQMVQMPNGQVGLDVFSAAVEGATIGGIGLTYPTYYSGALLEARIGYSPSALRPSMGKIATALIRSPFEMMKFAGRSLWRRNPNFLPLFGFTSGDPTLIDPNVPVIAYPVAQRFTDNHIVGGALAVAGRHASIQNDVTRFAAYRRQHDTLLNFGRRGGTSFDMVAFSSLGNALSGANTGFALLNVNSHPYALGSLSSVASTVFSFGDLNIGYGLPQSLVNSPLGGIDGLPSSHPVVGSSSGMSAAFGSGIGGIGGLGGLAGLGSGGLAGGQRLGGASGVNSNLSGGQAGAGAAGAAGRLGNGTGRTGTSGPQGGCF